MGSLFLHDRTNKGVLLCAASDFPRYLPTVPIARRVCHTARSSPPPGPVPVRAPTYTTFLKQDLYRYSMLGMCSTA